MQGTTLSDSRTYPGKVRLGFARTLAVAALVYSVKGNEEPDQKVSRLFDLALLAKQHAVGAVNFVIASYLVKKFS